MKQRSGRSSHSLQAALQKTGRALLFALTVTLPSLSGVAASGQQPDTNIDLAWLSQDAANNRLPVNFDGRIFGGAGWSRLLEEGRAAWFFLLGEEHGIAENPQLAAQLFNELAPSGYRRMLIEVSPPMAMILDDTLKAGGLEGLRNQYAKPGGEPAFFGMKEEAEMLAAIRNTVPADQPSLWGADYEVAGDRALIRRLQSMDMPAAARRGVDNLASASKEAWAKAASTGNFLDVFTFSGDPQLVRDIRLVWPDRNAESEWILETLEETLEINQLWTSKQGLASNERRARFLRENFLRYWRSAADEAEPPRVMAKFGANHMVRGRNWTQTFDLGNLIPEIAALERKHAFSIMVVPGKGSSTAVLNPTNWSYVAAPPKDGYQKGIEPLVSAAYPDKFTLIDLRPLRANVARKARSLDQKLVQVVFGFDMLLVMSGSTASAELDHN